MGDALEAPITRFKATMWRKMSICAPVRIDCLDKDVLQALEECEIAYPNSQIRLRYDTVGHMYHTGAYAKVVDATVAAPYGMEVEGPEFMMVGDIAQMSVAEAVAGSWSWSSSGDADSPFPLFVRFRG